MSAKVDPFVRHYFHGTRADLAPGDLIVVGHSSNFETDRALSWVYFTGTLDAAIWGAELSASDKRQRIYVVEPTGPIEDDPNVTDKKFPGNPTCPIAATIRFGSSPKSRNGRGILNSRYSRCWTGSPG